MSDMMQRSDMPSDQTHAALKKITEPTDEATQPRPQGYEKSA